MEIKADKLIFDNNYILSRIEENKNSKTLKIIQELRKIVPLSDDELLELYNKSVSIHQSKMKGNGDFLENDILVDILNSNSICYKKQVTIDKLGLIVGFNEKKRKCYHIIDFVVGEDIEVGKSIKEYKVISCKTTCRERWTQDEWSYKLIPKLYILLTISNDYPSSDRFEENSKRKIITCLPKKKDDRIFKLNFENLIDELV
jgi:arsenate reductase-like glutaredoxin family protein